ncbi:MAG: tetratricopeptide repeat protein [Prevotellaceae bacterium]|jgi:tetratricopeptide (TPR) repeat protein|nr:tetratricopeptide repeat protein [Prevotellaceae bacterium]
MKQVKFLLLPLFALVISFGVKAQDINAVVEQFNKGNDAFKAENYEQAIADLEAAYTAAIVITDEDAAETVEGIKTNCKNMIPFSYSSIAGSLATEGKYDEAIDYFNKSLAAAEKYGNTDITKENVAEKVNAVYSAQAADFAKEGAFDKAIETVSKTGDDGAIDKIKKFVATSYLKEAQTAQRAKDYKTAVEKSKQAADYNPESESAYLILGVSYSQLKQYKNAVDALEKCVALKESAQAYYYLAAAYQQSGNNAKACQNYKKVNDPKLSANAQAQMKALGCK